MAIKSYYKDGKKLYEVYLNGSDARGRRVQRRKRGLLTLKAAEKAQFELKRELALLKEQKIPPRWDEWFDECLNRMRLTYRPSTIFGYDKQLRKWVSPEWGQREIHTITKSDVFDLIFKKVEAKLSPHTRKSILKNTKRIFEMAVEEGILERNPCVGIKLKVPEVEQMVLTNEEVHIFLREAKITNHRFYPM